MSQGGTSMSSKMAFLRRKSSPSTGRSIGRSGSPPTLPNGNRADLISVVQSRKSSKDKFKELLNRVVQGETDTINARGEHGNTALHHAVLGGEELCIKVLIAFGADVNATNDFQMTPLDMASKNQKDELVPLLVSVGCLTGELVVANRKSSPPPSSSSSSHFSSSRSQSRSPTSSVSSTNSRRRSVSRPRELPGCSPETVGQGRRASVQPVELAGSPGAPSPCVVPRPLACTSTPADALLQFIDERFDASSSLKEDEAIAVAHQLKELHRHDRARKARGDSPRATPCSFASPIEFRSQPGGNRILCLDGGGMRGLIQIEILCELERMTGKKITELFDVIMGTSTGGILALGLVYKNMTLTRLRQLFVRLKDEIFSKSRVGGYNSKALEDLLKKELGCDMKMSDKTYPKVFVAAVDKSHTPLKLHWFNNCLGDEFSDYPIWKVARYTSAAPTYFSECDNYVDGGVLANNPCEAGLAHLQEFYHNQGTRLTISCMVSVGTGIYPKKELGSISGPLGGVPRLLRLIDSAIGESEGVAERCKHNCDAQNIPFYRFSPRLSERISPAETDSYKLIEMVVTSRIHMHTQAEVQLDKLVPLLTYSLYSLQ